MQIIDKSSIKFTDYLYVFLLYMISGNRVFDWEWRFIVMAAFLGIVYHQKVFDRSIQYTRCIYFLAAAVFVFLCQLYIFKWNSFPAIVNFCSKVFCAYAVVKILGVKFRSTAFVIMFWLCAISLVMFGIYTTTGYAPDLFGLESYKSIGLWNVHTNGIDENFRNAGPFWEPGAFAGYITMTLMLFLDDFPQLYKENKIQVIVIIAAFITTFSTTGYIVAFVFAAYVLLATKARKYAFLFVPIAIGVAVYASHLDFMGDKINEQLEEAEYVNINGDRVDHGRFSSMIFDQYYIEKHPIFGNGLNSKTRYADHLYMADNLSGFGNGLTGFAACMGIPFALLFFFYIYKNSLSISYKYRKYFIPLMLALFLYGEYYQNYAFIFIFIFYIYSENGYAKVV